jgi:hypothetical protein
LYDIEQWEEESLTRGENENLEIIIIQDDLQKRKDSSVDIYNYVLKQIDKK